MTSDEQAHDLTEAEWLELFGLIRERKPAVRVPTVLLRKLAGAYDRRSAELADRNDPIETTFEAKLGEAEETIRHLNEELDCLRETYAERLDRCQQRIAELREALPEVECPECRATIRARMADGPGQLAEHAVVAAATAMARRYHDIEWGDLLHEDRAHYRAVGRLTLEAYFRALADGPAGKSHPAAVGNEALCASGDDGHDPRCMLMTGPSEPVCDCRIWKLIDEPENANPWQIHLPPEPPRDRVIEARDADGELVKRWTHRAKAFWQENDGAEPQAWTCIVWQAVREPWSLWSVPAEGGDPA